MDQTEEHDMILQSIKRWIIGGIFAIFALIIGFSSFFTTAAGITYVLQDTLLGRLIVYTEPGVHAKIPFFTTIYEYPQAVVISFGNQDASEEASSTRQLDPVSVQFADTYIADIPATFRFKLSSDVQKILLMHSEFRGKDNLIDSLMVKNAKNVTVVTGTQYTGEEFFQGGLNDFKVKLENQLTYGLYQTTRKQVEVQQTDFAAVNSENSDANKLESRNQLVWKNVITTNAAGAELRISNPLELYGISVRQVTIGRPEPDPQLTTLLRDKKLLVAKRITSLQEQDTARTEAKTIALNMEIEKARDVQKAQKEKELAIIRAVQQVEVERQTAELEKVRQNKEKQIALLKKQKELEMAVADKDIQNATAQAAKFKAESIRETGLAEADVARAKYKALQDAKDIYMAELARDTAQIIYPNLKDITVSMPDIYYGGGSSVAAPTSLDIVTSLGALDKLTTRHSSKPFTGE